MGKAIERVNVPTLLVLSRQNLVHYYRSNKQLKNISKGGYILKECLGIPKLIIIATGSEVYLAVELFFKLIKEGHNIRVVSMPSTNIFDLQEKSYREFVLPSSIKFRVAIEDGSTDFWYKYVGL